MAQVPSIRPADAVPALQAGDGPAALWRQLLWLALPVLAEHVLHMLVGLTDTWLANHLRGGIAPAATAAVGTISYILWFIGLIVGTIATGSMAIIARAKGARHRSLANSVCGQSIAAAALAGAVLAVVMLATAPWVVGLTQLPPGARGFALSYLRLLSLSLPFTMVMFAANACLRGAGDTLTPAVSMIVVDAVNMAFSFGLTYGWAGLPALGFTGIAIGTVIAYVLGGVLQFAVLLRGRGGIRLYLHRLRPHARTLKRIFRIGLPAGAEGLLTWLAQFAIIIMINKLDRTSVMAAAHVNAVRIESISYMIGFAVAMAAAAMVGQSLGMKDPRRAERSAYIAYAMGGGVMTLCGILFIVAGGWPARWLAGDQPAIAALTTRCLFITGFIQCGFAAAAIFGGALRGAGDTMAVMLLNLASTLGLRLVGVLVVAYWLRGGLQGIWIVLSCELFLRGLVMFARFQHGGWHHAKV